MLMERKIYNEYNLKLDYLKVRKEAEAKATAKKGAFCNIHDIYANMPDKKLGITEKWLRNLKKWKFLLNWIYVFQDVIFRRFLICLKSWKENIAFKRYVFNK